MSHFTSHLDTQNPVTIWHIFLFKHKMPPEYEQESERNMNQSQIWMQNWSYVTFIQQKKSLDFLLVACLDDIFSTANKYLFSLQWGDLFFSFFFSTTLLFLHHPSRQIARFTLSGLKDWKTARQNQKQTKTDFFHHHRRVSIHR